MFRSGENILGNYCPADIFLQQDVRPILAKFTSAYQHAAALYLYRMAITFFAAPLDKRAVTETDGPAA